jgi:hypothetical protein
MSRRMAKLANIEDINGLAGVGWPTSKLARPRSKLASVAKIVKPLIYIYILSPTHEVGQIPLRLGHIMNSRHGGEV